ncbi:ubiquitin carboxyl-terminal hydrolase 2 isoform X2 [Folsomia candida]|uniref:ubiquitin carboxyl-terminal hydrolase 2 isoform X2 n=1 Tax=Folsomia candida TaxID=158441 RepID=UPI001605380B|nr:ubiquitin carboxyl-terminal hydrolase 2 isoform X2 [Folsomia candida]
MPVPESSYSRRYGREDSSAYSSTYSRSTSSSALGGSAGRSSYLSYTSKATSTLPPRPPTYEYRSKYADSSSIGSRFLSNSASRVGGRDYGSSNSYRTSVSPVRASASSIRRQLEATAPTIAERIKAMELGESSDQDATTAAPSTGFSSRVSRLRSSRGESISASNAYSSSSPSYSRDRSGSREFGSSPLISSSYNYGRGGDSSNKSSTENLHRNSSRVSPSPNSGPPLSRSGSGAGMKNGLSSRLGSIEESDALTSSPRSSGRFRSKDGFEKAGLTGLRNIGNTCFMNTVLQCLSNTRPLLEYVMGHYDSDINRSTSGMKGALMRAFGELIHELWRDQRVVDTSAFKDSIQRFAPRFMGYSQQDAQEFLRYLLEGLHEDVNRVTAKPTPITTDIDESLSDGEKATESWRRYMRYESSRIVDMFVGQFKSTLKCTVCGHCSVTFDPFWDLSLPIPSRSSTVRLSQCFELLTKEEVLDGEEKPTCAKCQCRRKCTKSLAIQKFPKILVVHLKRFSLAERYRGKLSTLVDYPLNGLDLTPFSSTRGNVGAYNLYGVANHSGSTYSGHYIAYCKHPYSNEWHCYNDSRVSPISSHSVVSPEGYVLFYEQVGQSSLL